MIRRLLVAAGVIVVLAALAGGGVYWFLSGDGVRQALEREATAWLGEPVRIGHASVALFPRVTLQLRDVRAGEPARIGLDSVDISAPLRALLARRVEDAELVVSNSRIEMPLAFAPPSRTTGTSVPAAAALAAGGVDIVSVRRIALRNVTLASLGREIQISADSSLVGTDLAITRFEATAGATRLTASGTAVLSPHVDIALQARADTVDLDDLLALAAAFTAMPRVDAATATPPRPVRVKATISAPRGQLAGIGIARLEASMLADSDGLIVDPLSFDVFGGRQNGWLDVQFSETLQVRLGTSLFNLDVAQLAEFGAASGAITGRLTGSGRFGARGRDLRSVLATARGVGDAVITSGHMQGLDIVRAVVRVLGGNPETEAAPAGEPFNQITATFALGDGIVRSDDLAFRAPEYDVFARGTLRLDTDALNGGANLVLTPELSARAGRDLYRYMRTGDRIVLPATIGGTISQPRVRIDAAAALQRGIRNEVERRLRDLLGLDKTP